MKIDRIESSQSGDTARLTARVLPDSATEPVSIWFEVQGAAQPIVPLGDPLALAYMVPCMFEREDLHIEAPVSAVLLENLKRAQEVLAAWHDVLKPIRVTGAVEYRDADWPAGRGVGCCFSGGVDSWYSLLKHERRITHLMLVRGFEIGTENDALWTPASQRVRDVAEAFGKRLVTISTNLRSVADKRRASWGRRYDGDFWGVAFHGSALAAVATSLQQEIGNLVVPATYGYAQLHPWGSSPLLDHWWSGEALTIEHDGCEATRTDKIRRLSGSALALQRLRVCYFDTDQYNCCRCEKCLRTMMALRICGVLDRASSFAQPLDLAAVRRLRLTHDQRFWHEELLAEAERAGDEELADALRVALGHRFAIDRFLHLAKRQVGSAARAHLPAPAVRVMQQLKGRVAL
jgi:hypothetical protein